METDAGDRLSPVRSRRAMVGAGLLAAAAIVLGVVLWPGADNSTKIEGDLDPGLLSSAPDRNGPEPTAPEVTLAEGAAGPVALDGGVDESAGQPEQGPVTTMPDQAVDRPTGRCAARGQVEATADLELSEASQTALLADFLADRLGMTADGSSPPER